jgi:hypothetical protein
MKNLYEASAVEEVKNRLAKLGPESERQWGKMTPAQTLAHCSLAIEMAMGNIRPPRVFIGRIFGPLAKRSVITKGQPIPRNAGTDKSVLVADDRDFPVEMQRLLQSIDRFATGGPTACTTHPHFFFGPMNPVEWAQLGYQHLDHHLRQFGA